MDTSGNPGPSYSKDNTQTQQKHQNSSRNYRSRPQVERELPYKDLRDLLNHKRQSSDGKNVGPPADPKYNYLSDPMREDSSNSTATSGTTNVHNNFGGGRFSNQRFNFRNRGRGRSSFPPENSYHQKPGYNNEPSRFSREWDQGKEDPRSRRSKPHYSEGPSNDTSNFRYQENNSRPINPNYKGPPHKYNPNYRGGTQKRFPPRRYPHPEPINISVEYNVEDGFRKCTALDVKLDKNWKKRLIQQPIQVEAEENWDEDDALPLNPEIEETRGDNPKASNIAEGSKIVEPKSKTDLKKPSKGGGVRKKFASSKIDRGIEAPSKNEQTNPGNAEKDTANVEIGGASSKIKPKAKDVEKNTSEAYEEPSKTNLSKSEDVETKTPDVETKTPDVETRTPEVETRTPEVQTKTPDVETKTPEVETRTPKVETRTPEVETITPEVETKTPDVETKAPEVETKTPDVEIKTPEVETNSTKTSGAIETPSTTQVQLKDDAKNASEIVQGLSDVNEGLDKADEGSSKTNPSKPEDVETKPQEVETNPSNIGEAIEASPKSEVQSKDDAKIACDIDQGSRKVDEGLVKSSPINLEDEGKETPDVVATKIEPEEVAAAAVKEVKGEILN